MENRIKSLKPRKNSKFHQGMVDPRKCKKVFESCLNEPIIYRSGLELQFIQYCEQAPRVIRWASEPISIRYYSRLDKKEQNYYPDFVVRTREGKTLIVEIKPGTQTEKPSVIDTRWAKTSWIRNCDKWNAAYLYCAQRKNMEFVIISEDFFTMNRSIESCVYKPNKQKS